MGSRCRAARSKEHPELTRGHMQCGTLSPINLQKNRKLNWMMTAVAAQKSHCVELTGIVGLKIWQTTDISHYGCHCTWLWCSHNKSHTSSVWLPWIWGSPLQQVAPSITVRPRKKKKKENNAPWFLHKHCPNRIFPSHHTSLFWPLSKTQPSGLPWAAHLH